MGIAVDVAVASVVGEADGNAICVGVGVVDGTGVVLGVGVNIGTALCVSRSSAPKGVGEAVAVADEVPPPTAQARAMRNRKNSKSNPPTAITHQFSLSVSCEGRTTRSRRRVPVGATTLRPNHSSCNSSPTVVVGPWLE